MRLVSYRSKGFTRLGLLQDGLVVDLEKAARRYKLPPLPSDMLSFLYGGGRNLAIAKRAASKFKQGIKANGRAAAGLSVPLSRVKLATPVPNPQKVICIGQNYKDHCLEQGIDPPKLPVIFAKYPTSLVGPTDPIMLPRISNKIDYEVELAFIIGKRGKNIPISKAYEHVAGYMVLDDVTARDIQFGDGQWVRGKSFDTFAPCGPYLVTRDEVATPHNLKIELKLNGKVMQSSNTLNLIFKVPYLVSFISKVFTLMPGDIVTTGTPPGVGVFRKPPVFLKAGDVVEASVEGLGQLKNPVVKK
jgi:2-keto-4-pentenoate hydratase/2-oxohepta-3-ene-1,7-dioic acid hydratase in catechol pathway